MKQDHSAGHNHKKEDGLRAPEPDKAEEKLITIPQEEYDRLLGESAKNKEYQDKYLRLQADFENARKRLEKQYQDFSKYANEGIILGLLNILDDLERAATLAENKGANLDTFLKGVEMILAHLYEMLKEHGLKPVEVMDKPFDPATSEALMQVEADVPEHTVIEELQKGYYLNDRVVRTAKVKVSKHTTEDGKHKTEEK
jgi:molecular chaperone GrpE